MIEDLEEYCGPSPVSMQEIPCAYLLKIKGFDKFYVGSTLTPARRQQAHLNFLKRGVHVNRELQEAYNTGGPVSFVLYVTPSRDEAYQLEEALIDFYLPQERLFNIATNARNGLINLPRTEEHNEKIASSLTGKRHSKESLEKMSLAKKGVPVSSTQAEHLRKIASKKKLTVVVNGIRYDGVRECSRAIGVEQSVLRHRLKSPNPKFADWYYLGS